MRLQRHTLATLLAASAAWSAAAQEPAGHHGDAKPAAAATSSSKGTIVGRVAGSDDDSQPWSVVVEGGPVKLIVKTDERGNFAVQVPAGSYTAHVLAPPEEQDRRAKYPTFNVRSGQRFEVALDPMYERLYCTRSGDEMVVPARSYNGEEETLESLRRPYYDPIKLKGDDGVTRNAVMQYCVKSRAGNSFTYKSAVLREPDYWASTTASIFDPHTHKVNALGDIYLYHHGAPPVQVASFDAKLDALSPVLNLTGRPNISASGSGSISTDVTFNFQIDWNGVYSFHYKDKTKKLELSSGKEGCVLIKPSPNNSVTISFSARLSKNGVPESDVHDFNLTLQNYDSEKNKALEISIPSKSYYRQGPVTGALAVKDLPVVIGGRGVVSPLSNPRMSVPVSARRP